MRFILSLVTISVVVAFLACQSASSSTSTDLIKEAPAQVKPDAKNESELVRKSAEPAPTEQAGQDDDVKRITPAEAKEAYDSGNAFFIDSRSKSAYQNEHIDGAISIPVAEFEDNYSKIPKDKTIIVYCS